MANAINSGGLTSFLFCTTPWFALQPQAASGHGYLASPRSRNLLASQETVWWPLTEDDPEPETCPHCLGRGGSLAQCGVVRGDGAERNYDAPKNALGGRMPTRIQANYTQGQSIVLDVTLTAHHKVRIDSWLLRAHQRYIRRSTVDRGLSLSQIFVIAFFSGPLRVLRVSCIPRRNPYAGMFRSLPVDFYQRLAPRRQL